MKRILFAIALMLFIGVSCTDKKSRPVLDGFFELKLGMTEAQIRQLIDTTFLENSDIVFDDEDEVWLESINAKSLYLDKYEVDTNFILKKIHLSFFQDTLYSIMTEDINPRFLELLKEKYGVAKSNEEDFKGAEGEKLITTIWNTNDPNIYCMSALTYVTRSYFQLTLSNIKTRTEVTRQIKKKKEEKKLQMNQPLLDRI